MEHLPEILHKYYYSEYRWDSLKKECIKRLIRIHINIDVNFNLVDALYIKNVGAMIVCYHLIDKLCQKLNIRIIEELFEEILKMFSVSLERWATKQLLINEELVTCCECHRKLLPPNDIYYYTICNKCGYSYICSQKVYYEQERDNCFYCGEPITYLTIPIGYKIVVTKGYTLDKLIKDCHLMKEVILIYHDESKYREINDDSIRSKYDNGIYLCAEECNDEEKDYYYKLKIFNRYNLN